MNLLLLNGLPEEYKGYPISADYRNMIQVNMILREPDISDAEKTVAALEQLYPETPPDIQLALDGLTWFYSRGELEGASAGQEGGKPAPRAFDFDQDANLIYAAFYAAYGISLTTVEFLHWWEFMALLEGLPENTLLKRIMYYRTVDINELSKAERKHVKRMKQLFALKGPVKERLSMEDLEAKTKADLIKRYEQAKRWKERKEKEVIRACMTAH